MNTTSSLSLGLIDQIIDESASALQKDELVGYLPKLKQTIQSLVQSLDRSDQKIKLVVSKLESCIQMTDPCPPNLVREIFQIREIVDTLFQSLNDSTKHHPRTYKKISVHQFIKNTDPSLYLARLDAEDINVDVIADVGTTLADS